MILIWFIRNEGDLKYLLQKIDFLESNFNNKTIEESKKNQDLLYEQACFNKNLIRSVQKTVGATTRYET